MKGELGDQDTLEPDELLEGPPHTKGFAVCWERRRSFHPGNPRDEQQDGKTKNGEGDLKESVLFMVDPML